VPLIPKGYLPGQAEKENWR